MALFEAHGDISQFQWEETLDENGEQVGTVPLTKHQNSSKPPDI